MKNKWQILKICFAMGQGTGRIVAICLLSAMRAGISVGQALLLKLLIDSATEQNADRFGFFCLLTIGASLIQLLLRSLQTYTKDQTMALLRVRYQRHFYKTCLTRDYPAISRIHSGELMHRMSEDVMTIVRAQTVRIPELVSYTVQIVGAAVVLAGMDLRFTLIYLGVGACILLPARWMFTVIKRLQKEALKADAVVRSGMQETLPALGEIKAFGARMPLTAMLTERQARYLATKTKQNRFSALSVSGFHLLLRAGHLFALIWCCVGILKGRITLGTLSAVQHLVSRIQNPISGFSGMFAQIAALVASAERLIEIEDLREEDCATIEEKRALQTKFSALSLSHVSFAYEQGSEEVIRDLSLHLKKGQRLAMTGESGVGKTTLLRLLLGLYPPQSGELLAICEDGSVPISAKTRALFSYVPQMPTVFSGTIRENLLLMSDHPIAEEQMHRALRLACCEFVFELPDGIDSKLGEMGAGLSQGQLQRLAIARALLSDAPVMLLDEATSALDEQTERRLIEQLASIPDLTGIFITHRKSLLALCDAQIRL